MLKPLTKIKTMKHKLFAGGSILMLAAMSAMSADSTNSTPSPSTDLYRTGELSLDGFGTVSVGKYTIDHFSGNRIRQHGQLGAGLGLNYFFTRNLGISAEAYSENTTGSFVDNASGNLTLRLPLGQSGLAPYIFGGGGRQFDRLEAWFGQAGGGAEYRFNPHLGVFVDARMVLPDEAKYYGVARLGLRFAF